MASSSTSIPPTVASSSSSFSPAYNTRSSKATNSTFTTSPNSPLRQSALRNPSSSSAKTTYLLLYNFVSALAWTAILVYTVAHISSSFPVFLGQQQQSRHNTKTHFSDAHTVEIDNDDDFRENSLYTTAGALTRWTQTAALAEIGHALLGLVRASPLTTTIQVSSRLFLVWAIVYPFPSLTLTRTSIAYPTMLLAWSITEVVRYTYFIVLLNKIRLLDDDDRMNGGKVSKVSSDDAAVVRNDQPPPWLVWLRYNLFFVLYPLGILSEMRLVYLATGPAVEKCGDERVGWLLWAILAVYVPGSYVMITHMMAQRRRVKRGKAKSRTV